jgi:hypothetical protein
MDQGGTHREQGLGLEFKSTGRMSFGDRSAETFESSLKRARIYRSSTGVKLSAGRCLTPRLRRGDCGAGCDLGSRDNSESRFDPELAPEQLGRCRQLTACRLVISGRRIASDQKGLVFFVQGVESDKIRRHVDGVLRPAGS